MVGQAPDRSVAAIVGGDGSGYADENRHRVLAAALGHKSPGAIDLKLFQTYVHEWFAGVPVYSPRSAQPIFVVGRRLWDVYAGQASHRATMGCMRRDDRFSVLCGLYELCGKQSQNYRVFVTTSLIASRAVVINLISPNSNDDGNLEGL